MDNTEYLFKWFKMFYSNKSTNLIKSSVFIFLISLLFNETFSETCPLIIENHDTKRNLNDSLELKYFDRTGVVDYQSTQKSDCKMTDVLDEIKNKGCFLGANKVIIDLPRYYFRKKNKCYNVNGNYYKLKKHIVNPPNSLLYLPITSNEDGIVSEKIEIDNEYDFLIGSQEYDYLTGTQKISGSIINYDSSFLYIKHKESRRGVDKYKYETIVEISYSKPDTTIEPNFLAVASSGFILPGLLGLLASPLIMLYDFDAGLEGLKFSGSVIGVSLTATIGFSLLPGHKRTYNLLNEYDLKNRYKLNRNPYNMYPPVNKYE